MFTYEVLRGDGRGAVLSESDFASPRRIQQMIDLRYIRQLDDMPEKIRMTVREIQAAVSGMDADTVRVMLEGEDRGSARQLLERRLEVLKNESTN